VFARDCAKLSSTWDGRTLLSVAEGRYAGTGLRDGLVTGVEDVVEGRREVLDVSLSESVALIPRGVTLPLGMESGARPLCDPSVSVDGRE